MSEWVALDWFSHRRSGCIFWICLGRNTTLKGILEYNDKLLVSIDFNHYPASSIYESTLTKVLAGNFVKVLTWYDHEWGFSNRMVDTRIALMNAE